VLNLEVYLQYLQRYTDSAGNNPAPAYFYTDGTDCRPVSGQGDLGVTTGCS